MNLCTSVVAQDLAGTVAFLRSSWSQVQQALQAAQATTSGQPTQQHLQPVQKWGTNVIEALEGAMMDRLAVVSQTPEPFQKRRRLMGESRQGWVSGLYTWQMHPVSCMPLCCHARHTRHLFSRAPIVFLVPCPNLHLSVET
jgi:hypothetical protein